MLNIIFTHHKLIILTIPNLLNLLTKIFAIVTNYLHINKFVCASTLYRRVGHISKMDQKDDITDSIDCCKQF